MKADIQIVHLRGKAPIQVIKRPVLKTRVLTRTEIANNKKAALGHRSMQAYHEKMAADSYGDDVITHEMMAQTHKAAAESYEKT